MAWNSSSLKFWLRTVPSTNFLLDGTVPSTNFLLDGTVPSTKFLLHSTVPSTKFLLDGTVPATNHYLFGILGAFWDLKSLLGCWCFDTKGEKSNTKKSPNPQRTKIILLQNWDKSDTLFLKTVNADFFKYLSSCQIPLKLQSSLRLSWK